MNEDKASLYLKMILGDENEQCEIYDKSYLNGTLDPELGKGAVLLARKSGPTTIYYRPSNLLTKLDFIYFFCGKLELSGSIFASNFTRRNHRTVLSMISSMSVAVGGNLTFFIQETMHSILRCQVIIEEMTKDEDSLRICNLEGKRK